MSLIYIWNGQEILIYRRHGILQQLKGLEPAWSNNKGKEIIVPHIKTYGVYWYTTHATE